ncbi:hypothetical protein CEQ48_16355 [Vibrio tarriae]|uniref:Uncharacterized protein n=1 Tax=Vibrio tarriae TaxID=2014742 RepID=A0AAU8WIT1_9VIBR|nr:hypothetical protein [Vibrio tarriae]ASK56265.1 hypothetical protein CEQ48_16355 [Vibrio tarriae]
MKNRKVLGSKDGLSLVQVNHLDGNGVLVRVSYEVCDADGNVLGEFSSIGEAQEFIKGYRPEPPGPTFNM